jgi:hypothetical protein
MGVIDSNLNPSFSDAQAPQDYAATKDNSSVKSAMFVVRDRLIRIQRDKELVTVLAYTLTGNDSEITRYENCVITDLSFDTSPDSGYAIYPNISIEQVKTVRVKVVQASAEKIIPADIAGQGTDTDGKGNKVGTKGQVDGDTKPDTKQQGTAYWIERSKEIQGKNIQLRQEIAAKEKRNAAQ